MSAGLRPTISDMLAMGSDGALRPVNSVKWRQAHCTGPPLATQPAPWKACLELFQKQPNALSSWISAHALPLMTSSGSVLMLALQLTAGKSNGRAGLGYTARVLFRLQSSTSKRQRDGAVTSGPLMLHAAAIAASLATVKPAFHDTLWPRGRGSGRPTQPTVL